MQVRAEPPHLNTDRRKRNNDAGLLSTTGVLKLLFKS